jgi:hypothetical protein
MRRLPALLIGLVLALAALPAAAFDLTDYGKAHRTEIERFAVNNSLFTLYHEVAHLLIDQMDLPVIGREEDVADNIATWLLLQRGTLEANRALEDAAQGWIMTGDSYDNHWTDEDFASGYSPDRQRAMQIVCMIVGANQTAFRPVANYYSMHPDRQNSCHFEYELVDRSLRRLLGDAGAGTDVNIVYDATSPDLEPAENMLRDSGIMETVATQVRKGYRLDRPLKMTATECGEANAFYDSNTVEIIFCYELMDEFVAMYGADLPRLPAVEQGKKR